MADDLVTASGDRPATYLCSVSRTNPKNWQLARDVGMWGLTAKSRERQRSVQPGDRLVFWVGGRGYVGEGLVVEPPRAPRNKVEAPWPGGLYTFPVVVPMVVTRELRTPLLLEFVGDKQRQTNLSKAVFRRSLYRLPDSVAETIKGLMDSLPTLDERPERAHLNGE